METIGRQIRILRNPGPGGEPVRHALFDFDGTLSLLRSGWQEVMTAYFVEVLAAAAPQRRRAELPRLCQDFIARRTGLQTIYQALELEARVRDLGATPRPAAQYKAEYLRRLHAHIDHRLQALARGDEPPGRYLVRGAIDLLQGLAAAGVACYLASGTDVADVVAEARLLGLTRFFESGSAPPRIHGALEDYHRFSKRQVIADIVTRHGLQGPELVCFGDGFVEIEETARAGGIAVAVASREDGGDGFDPWKTERLGTAGAHVLVPDWSEADRLLTWLGVR